MPFPFADRCRRTALPRTLEEDLLDIIASGDTLATRWVVTGSPQQELMGIPASAPAERLGQRDDDALGPGT